MLGERRRCSAVALATCAAVSGAGCYAGSARNTSWSQIAPEPGWQMVNDVPFIPQQGASDCGAAALAMAFAHWRQPDSLQQIVLEAPPRDGGIRAGDLRDLARRRGFQAFLIQGTFADIEGQLGQGRPVIVGLAKPLFGGKALLHYEVVIGLNRSTRHILAWDPGAGMRDDTAEGFAREWAPAERLMLILYRPEVIGGGGSGTGPLLADRRGSA